MLCPILAGALKNQAGSGNIHHYPLSGGDRGSSLLERLKTYFPHAGTISTIYVVLDAASATGTFVVELLKNGSVVGTATVATSGTSASATGLSISVATTDYFTYKTTNNSNAARIAVVSCGFTPSTGGVSPLLCQPASFAQTGSYIAPHGISAGDTTITNRDFVIPKTGTLDQLFIHTSVTPAGGKTRTVTIYKNGSSTGLTATITAGNLVASDTNAGHAISVVAGDLIAIQCTDTDTFPASPVMNVAMQWTPADSNGTLLPIHWASPSNTDAYFLLGADVNSDNQYVATEVLNTGGGFGGNTAGGCVGPYHITGIYAKAVSAIGAGKTWTLQTRKNASANLTNVVVLSGTGTPGTEVGDMNIHDDLLGATDWVCIKTSTTGSPAMPGNIRVTLQVSGSSLAQIYNQTLTQAMVLSQSVDRAIGIERTADAVKTRVGYGGRQTVRISSTIYTVAVDATHTYVLNSTDGGVTWTTEQITTWAAASASICQGAGGQPVVLLTKSSDNALYPYLRNSGGGWTHKTNVGTSATNGPEGHQIMYDGTNYHLVYSYTHSTNHHRYVRHAVSAALSSYTYTYVDVGGTSGIGAEDSRGLAACMDGDGNIHMIWVGVNSGVYTLEYAKRTSGTWAAGEVIESFGAARPIYLTIATDSNKKPHISGTRTQAGVQNVFYRERTGSSWSASEYVASDAGPQTWPSLGFEDRQYPVVVFSWNQAGNTVHRYTKKSGVWGHQVVASDSTATKTEQLYDPYRNASVTLQGSFIVFQSSIMLFVTSLIIYGDAAAASGTAVLSQTIQIHGRDRVTHSISMSSIVSDPGHAYSKSVGGSDTYATLSMSQAVAKVSDRPRGATQSAFLSQGVDVAWVDSVGGFTTYSKTVQSNLSMSQQVVGFKTRVISITHTVNMSQVGPGLTRFKEVVQDLELNQIVDRVRISNLTVGPQSLTMSQVIGLNKSLNLGVTHNVALQQGAARIRAWVWNSTHYNPGWAAEYESDINDFVILGPSEAPTVEMTLPRPDWGDQDNLKWRPTAVRRNRSGQARVFKVPVYEELKVKFVGLMRKRAAEFRACIAALVGNNVRIRDQNGAWKDVVITSSTVTATQGGPESVTVEIEFEQKDKVA